MKGAGTCQTLASAQPSPYEWTPAWVGAARGGALAPPGRLPCLSFPDPAQCLALSYICQVCAWSLQGRDASADPHLHAHLLRAPQPGLGVLCPVCSPCGLGQVVGMRMEGDGGGEAGAGCPWVLPVSRLV